MSIEFMPKAIEIPVAGWQLLVIIQEKCARR